VEIAVFCISKPFFHVFAPLIDLPVGLMAHEACNWSQS
jgi:hypothetical protein